MRLVFGWHTSSIEFPGRGNVIPTAPIVVGIFDVGDSRRVSLYRLSPGRIAFNQNRIATLLGGNLRDYGEREDKANECAHTYL